MVYTSCCPEKTYPILSIYNLLFGKNERNIAADKVIFFDTDGVNKSYTYSETHTQVLKATASWKHELNLQRGDVVAICSKNHIDYPIVLHSVVCAGGATATIDHGYDEQSIAGDMDTVQAKYLITDVECLETTLAAARIHGIPEPNILVFGDKSAREGSIRCVDDVLFSSQELGTPMEFTSEEIMNDPAYLYFTSGTTGRKKAVIITQYVMSSNIHLTNWPYSDVNILGYTEFHHISALMTTMNLPLYFGSTVYIIINFSLRGLCGAIEKYKINMITTQPYVLSALAKDNLAKEYDLSSLKGVVCGGVALDNSVTLLVKEKLNLPILNVYGLTESLSMFHTTGDIALANGLGCLAYGFKAKLVDSEGIEVSEGQPGELWISGPTLSRGYYRNPEATAKVIDTDGYFHTGDLLKCDENGIFSYVDRSKDLIKYLLYHIYPSEIEAVLMTHPAVSDCAVSGIYNPELVTELPRAYVQLVEGQVKNVDIERELQEYADSRLHDSKRLRGGIIIVDSFPRTPSGKIQRRLLHENSTQTDIRSIA